MTADNVTVQVRNPDGTVTPQTRTLYSSHHGPIFTEILGIPLPWTPTTAFAMGDANAGNFRYLNHFFEVNDAQSVERARGHHRGIPGRSRGSTRSPPTARATPTTPTSRSRRR